MDRSLEGRSFRRSAAAGFAALAVSMGGAVALAEEAEAPSCSMRRTTSGSEWVLQHLAPHLAAPALVSKIARAAVAYALRSCS